MVSTWDKSLETGNAQIDNQHRALIKLTDELSGADHESHHEVLLILDRVMEHSLIHFLVEEALMTQVLYPPDVTKEMVEQHREFKSYARLRVLEFREGEMLDRKLADWIRRQKETSPSQVA